MASSTLAKSLRGDRVSQLRLRDVCSVPPSASIEEAVQCMTRLRAGCALVVEAGGNGVTGAAVGSAGEGQGARLVGIFTERDYLNRVVAPMLDTSGPVRPVMTPSPKTIRRDASVYDAVELMETGGYRHLPVVGENGQPVGVLSVKDIVHYLVEYFPAKVYNLPPTSQQAVPAREGA